VQTGEGVWVLSSNWPDCGRGRGFAFKREAHGPVLYMSDCEQGERLFNQSSEPFYYYNVMENMKNIGIEQ
jgi:hypothetical protein